jgi:hypothetical protein
MSVGPLIGYGTTIVTGLAGNGSAVATPQRTTSAAVPDSEYKNERRPVTGHPSRRCARLRGRHHASVLTPHR